MAHKRSIIFIAERGCGEIYDALALKYEKMRFQHLSERDRDPLGPEAELVIIDCGPSFEKGISVLKGIKTEAVSVPVILIAESLKENAIEVFRAGARQFFIKPVNLSELEETIEKLMGFRRNAQERRTPLSGLNFDGGGADLATSDMPLNLIQVIYFIRKNLSEKITLQDLADRAGLSKYHFCRFFARHTGTTPMQYVKAARVERAKSMIVSGNSRISSVALKSGFNNLSLFAKQFKKHTGQSPSLYRTFIRKRNFTWN